MNDKQVTLFYRFIVMQQNHWALYTIAYLLMLSVSIRNEVKAPGMVMWLMIGFVPFGLYLVRTHMDKAWQLWGIHIIICAAILLFPEPNAQYKLVFTVVGLFYCISSLLKRYREEDLERPVPILVPAIVGLIAMICLEYLGRPDFQQKYLILFIANIVLFFVAIFAQRFLEFLRVNKHSVGYMPVKNIFFEDVKAIVLFLGIASLLFLVIIHFEQMNSLVQHLAYYFNQVAAAVLKFILGLFEALSEKKLGEAALEGERGMERPEVAETNPIWDIIVSILLLALLVYILYRAIRLLFLILALFRLPQISTEVEEEAGDVMEISENIEGNKKKRFSFFQAMSPQERIRRRYKKKVLMSQDIIASEGKRSEMDLYTARECSEILTAPQMGDIYEKARYSPYECTAEDVKKMKAACTNSRKN